MPIPIPKHYIPGFLTTKKKKKQKREINKTRKM